MRNSRKYLFLSALTSALILAGCDESSAESRLVQTPKVLGYAGSMKVMLSRMIVAGVPLENIRFNRPEEMHHLAKDQRSVFDTANEGVKYIPVEPKYMANEREGHWVYNAELDIPNWGIDGKEGTFELIAYLVGVDRSVCKDINELFKVSGLPKLLSDQSAYYTKNMINDGVKDYQIPQGIHPMLDIPKELWGHDTGCFESFDEKSYVVYSLILTRP